MPKIIKKTKIDPAPYTCGHRCRSDKNNETNVKMNACRFERSQDVVVKMKRFGSKIVKDQVQHCILNSRFFFFPLFQEVGLSKKKVLKDFMVQCGMTVYNGKEKYEVYNEDGDLQEIVHLKGVMDSRMMLIQICDLDLARKRELMPQDIFVDVDDPYSEVREGITVLGEIKEYIDPKDHDFEDFVMSFCFSFDDMQVCVSESDDGNVIFDKGKFALVVYRNYMQSAMEVKKLKYDLTDPELYEFRGEPDRKVGDVGYSILINNLTMEYAHEETITGGMKITDEVFQSLLDRIREIKDELI